MNSLLSADPVRHNAAANELGLRMLVLFGSHAGGRLPPGPDNAFDVGRAFTPGVR